MNPSENKTLKSIESFMNMFIIRTLIFFACFSFLYFMTRDLGLAFTGAFVVALLKNLK